MRFPRTKCIKSIWEWWLEDAGHRAAIASALGLALRGQLAVILLYHIDDAVQEFHWVDAERSRVVGYLERAQEAVAVFYLAYEWSLNAEFGPNVNLTLALLTSQYGKPSAEGLVEVQSPYSALHSIVHTTNMNSCFVCSKMEHKEYNL